MNNSAAVDEATLHNNRANTALKTMGKLTLSQKSSKKLSLLNPDVYSLRRQAGAKLIRRGGEICQPL